MNLQLYVKQRLQKARKSAHFEEYKVAIISLVEVLEQLHTQIQELKEQKGDKQWLKNLQFMQT